jgi:hypothetical protein
MKLIKEIEYNLENLPEDSEHIDEMKEQLISLKSD